MSHIWFYVACYYLAESKKKVFFPGIFTLIETKRNNNNIINNIMWMKNKTYF